MSLPEHEVRPLIGANILIVEDESILALDLALTIEDCGASVQGPLHRMDQAMSFQDLQSLDAALLDVDVCGDEIFPFADRLKARGVPVVFHTGRIDLTPLRVRYPNYGVVRKPSASREILKSLACALSDPRAMSVGIAAS